MDISKCYKALFFLSCFVFAEYSGYRSTEFKVQALSGLCLQYSRDKKKKKKRGDGGWAGQGSSGF